MIHQGETLLNFRFLLVKQYEIINTRTQLPHEVKAALLLHFLFMLSHSVTDYTGADCWYLCSRCFPNKACCHLVSCQRCSNDHGHGMQNCEKKKKQVGNPVGLCTVVTVNSQISAWWYATMSCSSHWAQLTQTGLSRCVRVTTDASQEATDSDPHTWIKLRWLPCSNDPILSWVSIQVMHTVFFSRDPLKTLSTVPFCCDPFSNAKFFFLRLAAN